MHRVGSAGNTSNSSRPRKEKRLTYVLNDSDDPKVKCSFLFMWLLNSPCVLLDSGNDFGYQITSYAWLLNSVICHYTWECAFFMQHCAGVNCLAVYTSPSSDHCDYLFTGSRDGTLKRWALGDDGATCTATFESHVDWVYIPPHTILYFHLKFAFYWIPWKETRNHLIWDCCC